MGVLVKFCESCIFWSFWILGQRFAGGVGLGAVLSALSGIGYFRVRAEIARLLVVVSLDVDEN
jgi:uncharacterized membrane protein YczE